MWLRYSDISTTYPKPNDECEWNPYLDYDQWQSNEPKCQRDSNSCGYFSTSASSNNWGTTACSNMDAFACEIDPGTMIHAIEKPPNEYHCPEMQGSWHSEVGLGIDLRGRPSLDKGGALRKMILVDTKRANEIVLPLQSAKY